MLEVVMKNQVEKWKQNFCQNVYAYKVIGLYTVEGKCMV
jgi:hypothetical protein